MEKHHDLLHEFPAYASKIHELKTTNNHFRKLFDEYHETDHAIHRIETNTTPASDDYLNELRTKRVHLKDELYNLLNQFFVATGSCLGFIAALHTPYKFIAHFIDMANSKSHSVDKNSIEKANADKTMQ